MKKGLLTGVMIGITLISHRVEAKIITDTDCNGACTFSYNTETQELSFSGSGIITAEYKEKLKGKVVTNLIIHEGIAGANSFAFNEYGDVVLGTKGSVVKLPSSFNSCGSISYSCFYRHHFEKIDVVSSLDGKTKELSIGFCEDADLITDGKSNIIISGCYGTIVENLNIHCKGDYEMCQRSVKNRGWSEPQTQLNVAYYEGYNDDGKFVKYTKDGKFMYEFAKNGDYTLYDGDGSFLGNFMKNGQKRRIYTVDEAVAVTEKGAKNRFVLKYR